MQNSTRPNRPDLDATKVPTEIDIAWAAGIYEGEGTCRLCGKTKRGFMASVTQKDPEFLYWLRDWFGGSVRDNGAGQGIHTWDICGDRGRIFIALIYSRMTSRRRQQIDVTNALEFLRGRSPIGLNVFQLKFEMDAFYADHKEQVRLRKKAAAKKAYTKRYADPEYRAKYHVRQAESRKMQKQNSGNEISMKVIEMKKTA